MAAGGIGYPLHPACDAPAVYYRPVSDGDPVANPESSKQRDCLSTTWARFRQRRRSHVGRDGAACTPQRLGFEPTGCLTVFNPYRFLGPLGPPRPPPSLHDFLDKGKGLE